MALEKLIRSLSNDNLLPIGDKSAMVLIDDAAYNPGTFIWEYEYTDVEY